MQIASYRATMIFIAGLGNPGEKFKNTRHNVGFLVVDEFQKGNDFPDFFMSKKFGAETSEGILNDEKIVLVKPQTFMNESGKAVKKITVHYKPPITNLIVIHDDIDLPLDKIRIVKGRGAAGHKGVESIIKELGNKDFVRFRIGVKPIEGGQIINKTKTRDFVLKKFNKKEGNTLNKVIGKTIKAIELFLKEGAERAMSEYNR
ncbi:MAG: aminoacyl-tRNA hydrolase [Candidatus Staskawiczbacteria bacterium CG10_big_fil_rev_8_21_14_0_10_38_10]|uniref:Peptidyl-tRNA hydrolase n=1 Tax=Candidatus Staskawiczbacteria bacterium CG10_big_fil_rev_8_21_14_0_10_38_10 TaxID=1974891 RepID=A0A2H9T1W2_9BACT|nr:MAG: aminoacyl-tRNA hydrolase [Candidatus Staskawiczbacteria bacterium CG10_big_fil_rev_8_21_14_0_10_38_10]